MYVYLAGSFDPPKREPTLNARPKTWRRKVIGSSSRINTAECPAQSARRPDFSRGAIFEEHPVSFRW